MRKKRPASAPAPSPGDPFMPPAGSRPRPPAGSPACPPSPPPSSDLENTPAAPPCNLRTSRFAPVTAGGGLTGRAIPSDVAPAGVSACLLGRRCPGNACAPANPPPSPPPPPQRMLVSTSCLQVLRRTAPAGPDPVRTRPTPTPPYPPRRLDFASNPGVFQIRGRKATFASVNARSCGQTHIPGAGLDIWGPCGHRRAPVPVRTARYAARTDPKTPGIRGRTAARKRFLTRTLEYT